jgi:hypothetical protein
MKKMAVGVLSVLIVVAGTGFARPVPGDVFREYMWWNESGDAGGRSASAASTVRAP